MPIFEFKCLKCDTDFESLLIGSDKPVCTSCDSKDVKKLMSACSYKTAGGGGGESAPAAASSSSCGGCTANSCAGCGS